MWYRDITTHDRNPLKRYLQHKRLNDGLLVLNSLGREYSGDILDFGCGDGELCKRILARVPRARITGYEPCSALMNDATEHLTGVSNVVLVSTLDDLRGRTFDFVFCLEVFEHLTCEQAAGAIDAINRLLADTGVGVIGVPNEIYLPALFKGLFRMSRRYGEFDATFRNVLKASLGVPPRNRPIGEISPGLPYHFHHLGFDHRVLRKLLAETFDILRVYGSPSQLLGAIASSEIYFVFRRRN